MFKPSIGGLERVADLIATEAAKLGHVVEVVTDVPAHDQTEDASLPYLITRAQSFAARRAAFQRSDIVLFMNLSLPGLLAGFRTNCQIVISHQTTYDPKSAVLNFLKLQLTRFFPSVCASRFVANRLPAKSIVIHNPYDSDLFKPTRTARDREFVFCGRLVSDKGVDLLLNSFAAVVRKRPAVRLTIIGDGQDRLALERRAASLGLSERVYFAGGLSGKSLVTELSRHSCMVVPSVWEEPFGIVALEGIACCDTVIVTNRGGLPEAVGRCGLVVDASVPALANAMSEIANAVVRHEPLPGKPEDPIRLKHLRAHESDRIAGHYLRFMQRLTRLAPA